MEKWMKEDLLKYFTSIHKGREEEVDHKTMEEPILC
jgi:hypothetical protein